MPKPRKILVSLDAAPIIIAFLVAYAALSCVVKIYTGKNFVHLRQWIEESLLEPAIPARGKCQTRRLNERPRKTLEYETPAEKFGVCVASIS